MSSQMVRLERCEICRGTGFIRGIFHTMECAGCNGGGFVQPDGAALDYPALVKQLRLRLTDAVHGMERQQALLERAGLQGRPGDSGAMARRGGRSNWTGD